MAEVMALKEVLKTRTMEGELYEKHPDGSLTCFACGHLYKIDLKSFNDRNYRKLGGILQHVLDTVKMVYERSFWLELSENKKEFSITILIITAFYAVKMQLAGCNYSFDGWNSNQ